MGVELAWVFVIGILAFSICGTILTIHKREMKLQQFKQEQESRRAELSLMAEAERSDRQDKEHQFALTRQRDRGSKRAGTVVDI